MTERILQALPMVTEDGMRMDWVGVGYRPHIRVSDNSAVVINNLSNGEELERLVGEGLAKWVVEVKCPKTLYASIHESDQREISVSWDPSQVDDEVFLRPGMVAVQNLRVPGAALLPSIWSPVSVDIPSGWWLVQGNTRTSKPLTASLLTFMLDESLDKGCMNVLEDRSKGNLRFIVGLATGLFESRHRDRDIHIAGLISALALLGIRPPGEDDDDTVLAALKARLEGAGVPTWEDPVSYDPALAATILEPFMEAIIDGDDDD